MTNCRILLMEDNPADNRLLRLALADAGVNAELTIFENGADAIAFLQRPAGWGMPDLAIIDLNLPRRGGLEILQAMRSGGPFSAVPVIILTSSSLARDREQTSEFGIARFIVKPPNLADFLKVGAQVREVLSQE